MIIKRLEVIGKNLPSAFLDFSAMGNVVSGASDTGKTFAFECLQYMFGTSGTPKQIPQSDKYERVVLFLSSPVGDIKLERALRGGDYLVTEDGDTQTVERKDMNNRFLSLIGSGKKRLKTNESNKTSALSFSYLRPYFFVDEVSIMDKKSPVLTDRQFHTRDKSIFRLLLTGKDDSDLIAVDDPKTVSAKRAGSGLLLDTIISKFSSQLNGETLASIGERIERCNRRIEEITKDLKNTNTRSTQLLHEKQSIYAELDRVDEQGKDATETLVRFNLLGETYKGDYSRLEFISEGKHLLAQLPPKNCPYCGLKMNHVHDDDKTVDVFSDQIQKALDTERHKVQELQKDLATTITDIQQYRTNLAKQRKQFEARLREVEGELKTTLSDSIQAFQMELKELLDEKDFLNQQKVIATHIQEVEVIGSDIAMEVRPKKAVSAEYFGEEPALFALEEAIEAVLEEWLGKKVKVKFDKEAYDIVIDGRARQSFGKGYRSIYRAAFHIGILNYCLDKKLPHPGFLVLDSPLTTHEEPDDELEDGLEARFFDFIANNKSGQLIIFDNKQPDGDTKKRLKYVRFTGIAGDEYQGFIPVTSRQ